MKTVETIETLSCDFCCKKITDGSRGRQIFECYAGASGVPITVEVCVTGRPGFNGAAKADICLECAKKYLIKIVEGFSESSK